MNFFRPVCPALVLTAALAALPRPAGARTPFELDAPPVPRGSIDQAVFAKLQQIGIEPAASCSDAVFVRRVFIDVIGTLPTAAETRAFLQDTREDKRSVLIDRLLKREEFPDYWATKWGDL